MGCCVLSVSPKSRFWSPNPQGDCIWGALYGKKDGWHQGDKKQRWREEGASEHRWWERRPCVDCHAFEFMQRALQDLRKTAYSLDSRGLRIQNLLEPGAGLLRAAAPSPSWKDGDPPASGRAPGPLCLLACRALRILRHHCPLINKRPAQHAVSCLPVLTTTAVASPPASLLGLLCGSSVPHLFRGG
ncbi:neuropeptide-like protein C4orf48 homolog [Suricata suricatta]|uniref:neuropeptide-like protein C4orf48 homolog n=1 Tax=Suricata suricatta TaxID=37032 RepID=UPI001155E213|nr:neuropeptide-like protein C4orf48 homolog [Suricata suricatta]